jgi:hypothetical protein
MSAEASAQADRRMAVLHHTHFAQRACRIRAVIDLDQSIIVTPASPFLP